MSLPTPITCLTETFLTEVDRRLPGRLEGLLLHGSLCWGEFFDGSDVDFVGVWSELPRDLTPLRAAHEATLAMHPGLTFDGFHTTAAHLARAPESEPTRPAFYQGRFDPAGRVDINLVTWHELAERGIAVRGSVPPVYTDLAALLAFTAANLDGYWRAQLTEIDDEGPNDVGRIDAAIVWVTLGVARLHHLLATGSLTSKSGAGRYIINSLDSRWHGLAVEALRLREGGGDPSPYGDPGERSRDLRDFLAWVVECRGADQQ